MLSDLPTSRAINLHRDFGRNRLRLVHQERDVLLSAADRFRQLALRAGDFDRAFQM